MTMQEIFFSNLEICKIHEQRLRMALSHLSLLPITQERFLSLQDEEMAYLELMTNRFAKLQDMIGSKVFPYLIQCMMEDTKGPSFLDLLSLLEKLDLIPSVEFWIDLRNIRNFVSHEYPDDLDLTVKHLNQIYEATLTLLSYWETLLHRIETMKFPPH
jgi:hypothetical protein